MENLQIIPRSVCTFGGLEHPNIITTVYLLLGLTTLNKITLDAWLTQFWGYWFFNCILSVDEWKLKRFTLVLSWWCNHLTQLGIFVKKRFFKMEHDFSGCATSSSRFINFLLRVFAPCRLPFFHLIIHWSALSFRL